MKKMKAAAGVLLAILSAYMLLKGFSDFIGTSGMVQGSEFGMLITLANQLSVLMLWLGVFAFWRLIPDNSKSSSTD